jgi:hypothetical protein
MALVNAPHTSVLEKPFSPSELLRAIELACQDTAGEARGESS